jgi:hypothetical protein
VHAAGARMSGNIGGDGLNDWQGASLRNYLGG